MDKFCRSEQLKKNLDVADHSDLINCLFIGPNKIPWDQSNQETKKHLQAKLSGLTPIGVKKCDRQWGYVYVCLHLQWNI